MVNPFCGVRLDADSREQIDELIANGDFSNYAEFIKYAVRKTLATYKGRSPPPLGVIEGSARGTAIAL